MIQLREDQSEAVARLRASLRSHQSVMFQAACGFGKTVVAGHIAQGAHRKSKRVIFCVHRLELIEQTSRTFTAFGIPHGFIAAGFNPDPFCSVQIASADTLRRRRSWLNCHLFVPDEAHLWAADTRAGMIEEAKSYGAKIIGLSATPQRLDGRPLSPLFNDMVEGPTTAWLIENGRLSRYKAFAPVRPDMSGLHVRAGDYVTAELDDRFNKPTVIGDAIATWKQRAAGLRTLAFAFSRKHGAALNDAYNRGGISAVYIDGENTSQERRDRIGQFADGGAKVLVSVGLLVDGFDLSSQVGRDVPVEAVALLRPTASLPLAKQMLGRALRPKPNPAVIMDHVNLLAQHGLPDDEVAWSLEGRDSKSRASSPTVALSICEKCFFTGRPFKVCPECGHAAEVVGRQVEEVDGQLNELDLELIRRARKDEVQRARTLEDLARVARARGYKPGWLVAMGKARGQRWDFGAAARAMRV